MLYGAQRTSIPVKFFVAGYVIAPSGTGTVPLSATSVPVDVLSLKGDPTNTATIYIGPSGSEMYPLSAGDAIDFEVLNLNIISISGTSVGNQRICYIGGRQ